MSEGFNLPRNTAADLVFAKFKGDNAKIKTRYGEFYKGKSLQDQSIDALLEFTNSNSAALKRMKVAQFNAIEENCYQSHHISDDFTNTEQINLCKAEQEASIFGKFN